MKRIPVIMIFLSLVLYGKAENPPSDRELVSRIGLLEPCPYQCHDFRRMLPLVIAAFPAVFVIHILGVFPVSYTHLDVYKRQAFVLATLNLPLPGSSAAPIFRAAPGSVPAAVPSQRR